MGGDANIKEGFMENITRVKNKLGSRVEDEAVDFIIGTAKKYGHKVVTIILNLITISGS